MTDQERHLEKTFVAHIDSLEPILNWIRGYGELTGFSISDWKKIEVAIEEALVNIISYAYQPEKSGWIFFSCSILPHDRVEFIIKDKGKPFDPEKDALKKPNNDSLDKTAVGGLGLLLIHHYMDEVRYERKEPYNVLTLTKRCTSISA